MARASRVVAVVAVLVYAAVLVPLWACDPPGGGIHSPPDGATVSGTTTIDVSVTSETTVVGVDLYLDGNLLTSVSKAPYSYGWDTTKAKDGSYTLSAKVRAQDRPDGQIKGVSVTVKN